MAESILEHGFMDGKDDRTIRLSAWEVDWDVTIEELYQAFKKRLAEEDATLIEQQAREIEQLKWRNEKLQSVRTLLMDELEEVRKVLR